MRKLILLSISFLFTMNGYSQDRQTDRAFYAAGRFFSSNNTELSQDLAAMFHNCKKVSVDGIARAIIVPHAGYIYSGETAASAFSTTPAKGVYKNIFVVGSTHVMGFGGASVFSSGNYVTPLGSMPVNKQIADELKSHKEFAYPESYHNNDHTIEVQIPFIQHYYTDSPKIIPIIIGTDERNVIKQMAKILQPWFTDENLFVISSDFSHYPAYNDAIEIDRLTAEALMTGNPDKFLRTLQQHANKGIRDLATSMCGWTSGLLLLEMLQGDKALQFKKLDYCNSGDSPYGDKNGVVGYNAIGLYDNSKFVYDDLNFDESDASVLFEIARRAIKQRLNGEKVTPVDATTIPSSLKNKYGAFVTLKIDGVLRGCIGRFISDDPLYEAVQLSALSSAFEDPRFPPLSESEYPKLTVEITVLGPLKRIFDKEDIVLGKHGIYIKKGVMAGTMLPQVAIENNWNVDEFLSYTSQYKAGIGNNGWKTAELYIYEGLVLEE